jgi:methylthioribose-1-phosphate isomerase
MVEVRGIAWTGSAVELIDQTVLPHTVKMLKIDTVEGLVDAVQRLVVRGAPALGVAGALGVVIAMWQGEREERSAEWVEQAIDQIRSARPTAVNLAWGVDRVRPLMPEGVDRVLEEALKITEYEDFASREIGRQGADWILQQVTHRPIRVLTHCNTGSLCTTIWGTALGVVRELHARGELGLVYVDETRPLLQGSRLTSWELGQDGIEHVVQVDGAAASTILQGMVDVAIIGADRISAAGDTANKIGSLGVALACADAGIPFVVAAPRSTIDLDCKAAADIHVELRDEAEVLEIAGVSMAPENSRAYNPAFDVTPARLVTIIVTESDVIEVGAGQTPEGVYGVVQR